MNDAVDPLRKLLLLRNLLWCVIWLGPLGAAFVQLVVCMFGPLSWPGLSGVTVGLISKAPARME